MLPSTPVEDTASNGHDRVLREAVGARLWQLLEERRGLGRRRGQRGLAVGALHAVGARAGACCFLWVRRVL